MIEGWAFNPPPYWPQPPGDWTPPTGWQPDPAWGPVPPGWHLWVPARRAARRRTLLPVAGLGAILLAAALATVIPRAAGPGVVDPRVSGATSISWQQAALGDSAPGDQGVSDAPAASDPLRPSATPGESASPGGLAVSASPGVAPTASAVAVTAKPSAGGSAPAAVNATATPIPTVIRQFSSCAELNQVYPDGVGMPDATDRTTGLQVIDFGRSATIYRLNLTHDRDGDGIACEPISPR